MRLGHFDPRSPLDQIPISRVCSPEAVALAREGVSQSVVLLKNNNTRLPLSQVKRLAVIGPNAVPNAQVTQTKPEPNRPRATAATAHVAAR